MAFFGNSPTIASSSNFGSAPQKAAPSFGPAPQVGDSYMADDPVKGGSYWQTQTQTHYIFDFTSIPAELESLGQFSLIAEGADVDIPLDTQGRSFGLLQSRNVQAAEIDIFLGLDAGTLNSLTPSTATNGAVIKFTVPSAKDLEMIRFDWNFVNNESGTYDDFAFYYISDGQIGVLSSSSQINFASSTGWQQMLVDDLEIDGPVSVAFGVLNVLDTAVDAYLGVDQVELIGVSFAPDISVGTSFWG